MNSRAGIIVAGIGLLIAAVSFYFYDAAGDVVTPDNVMWGLGRLFRDIDASDVRLLQRTGLIGMALGGVLLLGGLILMYWRSE